MNPRAPEVKLIYATSSLLSYGRDGERAVCVCGNPKWNARTFLQRKPLKAKQVLHTPGTNWLVASPQLRTL